MPLQGVVGLARQRIVEAHAWETEKVGVVAVDDGFFLERQCGDLRFSVVSRLTSGTIIRAHPFGSRR